jgi:hypothetical protein
MMDVKKDDSDEDRSLLSKNATRSFPNNMKTIMT